MITLDEIEAMARERTAEQRREERPTLNQYQAAAAIRRLPLVKVTTYAATDSRNPEIVIQFTWATLTGQIVGEFRRPLLELHGMVEDILQTAAMAVAVAVGSLDLRPPLSPHRDEQ